MAKANLTVEAPPQGDIYLITEIQNGNGDAFRILAERYNYIVSFNIMKLCSSVKFQFRFQSQSLLPDKEDLYQECRIILYKAAKCYDVMKNVKFATYANVCVKNYLISVCRKYGRTKKYAKRYDFVPFDEIRENESGRYDRYFSAAADDMLFDALSVLSTFEKSVLMMYIEDKSYRHIAETLNKSVKSIDNAVCRIKSKLKPYAEYFISE